MHVGFLTPDLNTLSGWSHYSLGLIQALCRAGVRVTVVAARNSPPVEDMPVTALLPTVTPFEPQLLLKQMRLTPRVRGLLHACDLVHSAIEPYAPLGALVAGRRPLFITGHGSYVRISERRRWPSSAVYRWAFYRSLLVCVSRYTAKVAKEALPDIRTAVVNNGVDVERFAHLPPAGTPKLGPTVLSAGGVKARKGTLALVRAVAEVRREVPDVQCVVIGNLSAEPGYVERVQAEISALGLAECVHLPGHVPEEALLAWYGAADVFALPSMNVNGNFEGYGLVHLEASAAGLPVIGTTDCGVEDAIEDGLTGLLVPQAQVEDYLPQAILSLLKDRERARQMGAAGRAKALRQTWDHVAQQMIPLYEAALRV